MTASPSFAAALEPAGPSVPAAAQDEARAHREAWSRETRYIVGSHVLNGLLLSLFALGGRIPWTAGLAYAGPGLLVTAAVAAWAARGPARDRGEPNLTWVHSLTCATLCLAGVALYPELAFAYALILFNLALTATYRLPRRVVQAGLAVTILLYAALTLGRGRTLALPTVNTVEQVLTWIFFTTCLGRCVMLSVINSRNNRLLRERGQEMKAKLAEIERLAHHDELTGVLNRRRLLQLLDDALARHERDQLPLTVALFDLDHFKAVNDTLGHQAGDRVLQRFAAAVQAQTRNTDRFGRYGGEEFLVILHDTTTEAAHLAIARTRGAVEKLDWQDLSPELRITFSAGIATFNGSESAELLLGRADLGLYEAKRCGRNCSRAL
jgi:diguanylate cyclase